MKAVGMIHLAQQLTLAEQVFDLGHLMPLWQSIASAKVESPATFQMSALCVTNALRPKMSCVNASRDYLHGSASHLGSTAFGLSHRHKPTSEMPAIRKDGMAATRAMLSSLAFRI